ncbi:precorrin-6y C5,15-methyltransferase (decarboxylating) subunit CbiE [Eleftheria terrae]|uniref:precorrin-6y C5,15-methyltransferase (decarboxylating) subunit CbiE n=1 Tax=Eleftheria terrae TaxID=1597781 RepID=UPI00263A5D26|nr:precorrin-6y C5,15-methyltransferase (decarboxylating) subunit CbiE [Eleftheria terrae]WKB53578.1 precorrin-6y C5,15-methyltransferase (decarboxylating) subunit CbiE [Eleftheria terrae]
MKEDRGRFGGEPCRVIGVLDDGARSLHPQALAHLRQAHCVIGGERTLRLLAEHIDPEARLLDLGGALSQVPGWVAEAQQAGQRCVVLATGDPLCHGIAAYLASRLCIEALEILPNLSTLQLACARVGLPWQDIRIVSVHSRDAGEWVPGADARHGLYALARAAHAHARLAVLTSPDNTPDRIGRLLLAEGLGADFQCAVAQRLCQPEEAVSAALSVQELAERRFADPNVVLLWRLQDKPQPVLFGLPDARYEQRHPDKGLITKHEVRAVSLARLQLRRDSIVWDIGAGSGAVGLEAARLCEQGHVYAIEKNEEDHAIALRNRQALGVGNYSLVHGKAPAGLEHWPDPDAVFIGGSGGELGELIHRVLQRLKPHGCLVMNFVTFENLGTALATLKEAAEALPLHWDVLQLQASRSKPILQMQRLAAENPVWVVCASRGVAHA